MRVIKSTTDLEAALRVLLDYNWKDELEDFKDHEDETDCHIFVTMVALDNFINNTNHTPESYV